MRSILIGLLAAALACAQAPKTRTVILVTADGLRWQEVFGGVDPSLPQKAPARIAGNSREQLLPFFWNVIATHGVLLKGRVTNAYRVSYPGYSEILTGRAQDTAITGNDPIQNPTPTVLEFAREKLRLGAKDVALFGSWETLNHIGEHTPGAVTINAGYKPFAGPGATPRLRELSALQFDVLPEWTEVRHDYITFEMALEYLRANKPRLMHISFGETDDWAHGKNYPRYLEMAAYFDRSLRKLWDSVDQRTTTLVITTDHGRGSTAEDWNSHGKDVPGADRIWAAVIGPDTPTGGESAQPFEQRDIAPTVLKLLGIDPISYTGVQGKAISAAVR